MATRSATQSLSQPSGLRSPALVRLDAIAARVELHVLLFVAATLPFEFTKLWFPVSWLEVSRLGIAAGLVILVIHVLAGTLQVRRSPLLIAIGAVVAIELLSFATTRWAAGAKEAAAIVVYAGLAVFTAHVLRSRGGFRELVVAMLASALVVGLISIAQEVGGFYVWQGEGIETLGRRNSTFGDPNIAARFFAMMLVVGLAVLAVRWKRGARLSHVEVPISTVVAATISIMAIADVLTLSRIGWLTAGLAIAMWIPMAARRHWIVVGMAVFVFTFVGYLILFPSVLQRASTAVDDALLRVGAVEPGVGEPALPDQVLPNDPEAKTPIDGIVERLPLDSVRRYLVRAGTAMALDNPLMGVGIGGFGPAVETTYRNYVPLERRKGTTIVLHTDFMRIAAETGVAGLAAWVGLLAASSHAVRRALRSGIEQRRMAALVAGTIIVIIFVASQFAGRFYNEPYLWLAIGTLLAIGSRPAMDSEESEVSRDVGAAVPI